MRMSVRDVAIIGAVYAVLSPMPGASQTAPAPRAPAAQTSAAQTPPGNAENGKILFSKNACAQCHGLEAQGGAAGPRLGPGPIPFRGFVTYVRSPRGEMPPYTAKVMSDQELADVYAFLQARPRPPALASIPLLAP